MSWLKVSDDCFQYPKLLEILGYAPEDPRIRLEVFGFVVALASLSASHNTDYKISYGHIHAVAGARGAQLTELCEKVGILTKVSHSPLQWMIIADPDFLHMRMKDEVLWDRQQRKDTNDPTIYGPVRQRDGDNCRWCGVPVVWRGSNRNARKGSLDHLKPGEAGTVDTMVVSCLNCNASKKNSAFGPGERELLPVPTVKRYTQGTVDDLAKIGIYVSLTVKDTPESVVDFACKEPSAASSGGQVDPAGVEHISELELSSQACQPADDPLFDTAETGFHADRLSSQACQPADDPAADSLRRAPTSVDVAPQDKIDDSPDEGAETPVDAKTETVEIPPSSGEKSLQSHLIVSSESTDYSTTHTLLSLDSPGRVGSGRDKTGPDGSRALFPDAKTSISGKKKRRRRK